MISADAHLYRTVDNKIWAKTIYGYDFWKRYLNVFEEVIVVARIKNVDYYEVKGYLLSSGEGVTFRKMPMVRGTVNKWEYLIRFPEIIIRSKQMVKQVDCAIFRMPAIIAFILCSCYQKTGKPYAVEVVINPKKMITDSYIYKTIMINGLRNAIAKANGVSYVTEYCIQKDFPSYDMKNGSDDKHFSTFYTSADININPLMIRRNYSNHGRKWKITIDFNIKKLTKIKRKQNVNNYRFEFL